ncbi:MAG TPA: hypothetical protein VNG69_11860 [Casimicrobiaceae bacterium]|nr:hypothetical protein [Casimicrobiaceae bacterium]
MSHAILQWLTTARIETALIDPVRLGRTAPTSRLSAAYAMSV